MEKEFKKPLNKIHLQSIAILAMTLDHLTWLLFPGYPTSFLPVFFHILGRLAFPIMAYFIAEGYHYTRNKNKYMIRILIFALISHVPYMLQSQVFNEYGWMSLIPFATGHGITRFMNQASVLWAYFIGLLMLRVNDSTKLKEYQKIILVFLLCILSFPSDWSCIASLVVLSIGSNRGKPLNQIIWSMFFVSLYALVYSLTINVFYGILQLGVIISIIPLSLYNGQKSKNEKVNKVMKWFFYIYYPLHLLVLGIIGLFI